MCSILSLGLSSKIFNSMGHPQLYSPPPPKWWVIRDSEVEYNVLFYQIFRQFSENVKLILKDCCEVKYIIKCRIVCIVVL